jgi:xanthine dehydrogenase FAD-binding subunit
MPAIKKYLAPKALDDLIREASMERAAVLAGGTDLLPRWSRGLTPVAEVVIDIKRVAGFNGVSRMNGEILIGPCTSMSDIAKDPTIRKTVPVLAEAAGRIACPQIRNRATLGGNLCNASPAADTAIPLILLDAVVDCASASAAGTTVREVPITEFFHGPGSTVLGPGGILTRVRFKPPGDGVFAAWDKFGTRPAMEIAVASVGVALTVEAGKVSWVRVGYGSVAPIPLRGRTAEAELVGRPLTAETISKCEAAARDEIEPISDVRASAAYRREIVGVMLRRMLERAGTG